MRSVVSTPLTRRDVVALRAGDLMLLSGNILIVEVLDVHDPAMMNDLGSDLEEGSVCCLVTTQSTDETGSSCIVARVDEPVADRYVRQLLSRGARVVVGAGHCLATASYALRKYGGLFVAVEPDWIDGYVPFLGNNLSDGRSFGALRVLNVELAHLTVAHDAHGRTHAARSMRGGESG
jgi:tartrate dehydratase beta subunit/fumarate hydratase class I family protein